MPDSFPDELRQDVAAAVQLARRRDCADETSCEFHQPFTCGQAEEISSRLAILERRIDETASRIYGFQHESAPAKEPAIDRREAERRQISFAVGAFLGRWGDERGQRVLSPLEPAMEDFVGEIAGGFDWDWRAWLSREFLPWHNRLYRGRPVFWGFSGKGRTVVIDAGSADAELVGEILESVGGALPPGWQRWREDPIHLNLAPLAPWIADPKLRASLRSIQADLQAGRFDFSRTAQWMRESQQITKESNCESALLR
jgi:hypothetical protein